MKMTMAEMAERMSVAEFYEHRADLTMADNEMPTEEESRRQFDEKQKRKRR